MTRGLLTGTFNPFSLGHLNFIERASTLCDELFVGIAYNAAKVEQKWIEDKELQKLISEYTHHLTMVKVQLYDTLTVDYAQTIQAQFLIRALRSQDDLYYEMQMAQMNRKLGNLETVFLLADHAYMHISSSLIRELAQHGSDLKELVPQKIEEAIYKRLKVGKR